MNRQIVVCATQRSGSTLLCEDLRATGHLGLPHEHFLPYLKKIPTADWPDKLAASRKRISTPNGVSAVKVMMSYLGEIDTRLAEAFGEALEQDRSRPFPHFHRQFQDASFVWIRRTNLTRQAISREMALQTGVTHAIQDTETPSFVKKNVIAYDDNYNQAAVLDVDRTVAEIATIARENEKWLHFFSQWEIEPLVVEYEAMLTDNRRHVERVAECAGVDLPDWTPDRRLVKLSNTRSDEFYHQVIERLMQD